MFRLSRRQVLATAGASAVTVALADCGRDDSSETDQLSDNRAGAMSDYRVGDQFKATEPLSFSILYNNHPNYPLKKDWLFWSELRKRTNVSLTTLDVPMTEYTDKRRKIVGSDDSPLIIPKTYPGQEEPFAASGAVLPVSDYIDLMPHFKDKISRWDLGADLDSRRQADGKFYLLPGVHEEVWVDYSLAIRIDIFDKHRIPVPGTWDEFYKALKRLKSIYPGSYPLSDRFSRSPRTAPAGNLFNLVGDGFGAVNLGWDYRNATWDYDAEKYVFTGSAKGFKQSLEYLNKLVKEGLLDPASFSQSDEQARQKLAREKSFVISTNAQTIFNDYKKDVAKIPGAKMLKIPVPTGPMGEVKNGSRLENGIMLSVKARESRYFVAMMQFIDWLWYSDEGNEFSKWGVEGVTYTKDPTTKKRTLAKDVDVVGLNPGASRHLQQDLGFFNGVFSYGGTTELLESFFNEEELEFQAVMNRRRTLPVPPPYPFTDAEREQVTLWETPLQDLVTQNSVKFVLGQRSLRDWDAYLAELKDKKVDQYMDMVTRAYERFKKTNN